MLVGLALVIVMTAIGLALGTFDPLLLGVAGIGMLIPGVIAHDMFRQKPHKTVLAVAATTAIVAAFVYLFASLLDISPFVESRLPRVADDVGYPQQLLLL